MLFAYLKRGLLAGGVAGIAYGLFIAAVANPLVGYLEHAQHGHAHSHGPAAESVVAESTTALVSIGGGLLWAVFLGGCFGIGLYLFEPALPGRSTGRRLSLAGSGFLTVSAVPWLVLPPSAPGAEQLLAVTTQFFLYGGLVVLGAAVAASGVAAYNRLVGRHRWLAVAGGIGPILAAAVLLPAVTPTIVRHPELSTELLTAYQAMVVLSQGSIWLCIATTFGWLQRRTRHESTATDPQPAT